MREIEFRGINAHKDFVHGYLTVDNRLLRHAGCYIVNFNESIPVYKVDPATISQYTGLRDKNGKKIFEGDIGWDDHTECLGVVVFDEGRFQYVWETVADDLYEVVDDIEIRGNKWQNPELLEAEG